MKSIHDLFNALKLDGSFLPFLEKGWSDSLAACPPDELPFAAPEFLTRQLDAAGIDRALLAPLLEVAARFRKEEPLRLLAWHAHHTLCHKAKPLSFDRWPELDQVLGKACGLFYLMIGLSAIPEITRAYRELGIPERYAEASAKWLAGTVEIYRGAHGGTPGHAAKQLHWVRNYIDGTLFRIGRLEFMHQTWPHAPAIRIYRHKSTRQVIALAADDTTCSADGMVLYRDQAREEAAFITSFREDETTAEGNPVDPAGFILNRRVQLPLAEWEPVLAPGDFTPGLHIPGGGGMTPEACRESLEEALGFYAAYFPEKPVKAFLCSSWIFNPEWERRLPESNLAKWIRRSYLYPRASGGREGLFFLFGRDHGDLADYPRDNSARRAMLDILAEGGRLREEGMFFLPEELPKFDAELYRTDWRTLSITINAAEPLISSD